MTERAKRITWSAVLLAALSFLLRVDAYHRCSDAYACVTDCFGCSLSHRLRTGAAALLVDPNIAAATRFMPTIVGGRRTVPNEFPPVGALFLDSKFHCTGTLVRQRVVLTAAHCICEADSTKRLDPRRLQFAFGTDALTLPPRTFRVTLTQFPSGIPEPEFHYDPATFDDDVALVYLDPPITDVPTFALATKDPSLPDYYRYVGFGRVVANQPDVGLQTTATLHTWRVSARRLGHGDVVRSVCLGDSGGAALNSATIIGVTSTTNNCRGGESTSVAAVRLWIDNRIRKEP